MKKKRKHGLEWILVSLLGMICALVLGALFYGTMVYQLSGEDGAQAGAAASPAPLEQGQSAQALFPGALLSLGSGTLNQERAQDVAAGGETCRVITREYALSGGVTALAVSATPAAYMERLAQEGWKPQLITGFTLAGLDAVQERLGDNAMLVSRSGPYVYMLIAPLNEQALYALGVGATLEGAEP